jgi:hypothetical protein
LNTRQIASEPLPASVLFAFSVGSMWLLSIINGGHLLLCEHV